MSTIVSLDKAEGVHGGKAIGLRRLIENGHNVPPGLALSSSDVRRLLDGDSEAKRQILDWLFKLEAGRLLAIRSSAVNEDGPRQSFAGVYESVLGVQPEMESLIEAIGVVSKSGQSDRVVSYAGRSFDTIPVVIQQLVEARESGVLFTRALGSTGERCVYIEWIPGLGDALVSGRVTPATIQIPIHPNVHSLDRTGLLMSRNVPSADMVDALCTLAEASISGAERFGWDLEWAIDAKGALWVVQQRMATTELLVPSHDRSIGPLPASPGIAEGPVRFVDDSNHSELRQGDVLVAAITEVDYIPAMKRASAIVTEEGGLLSHAAIVAREMGKPCVVGAKGARAFLEEGLTAEVNGVTGVVRQGNRTLGSGMPPELDWTYLYLYDRGYEVAVRESTVYVEPTTDGLMIHLDEEPSTEIRQDIEAAIRVSLHQAPRLVVTDKRIWLQEWRRFEQLRAITFVQSLFKAAIRKWHRQELIEVIETFKRLVVEIANREPTSAIEKLFWGELGAALHALIWLEVEGEAVWSAYRDTSIWRSRSGVTFTNFVQAANFANVDMKGAAILQCLEPLGALRNEAYEFFARHDVFNKEYFGSREALVRGAIAELGLSFSDEGASLARIYAHDSFIALDVSFFAVACQISASRTSRAATVD